VPLRIAFDLDGVLADMDSALIRQAEHLFGEAPTRRLQEPVATASTGEEDSSSADGAPELTPPLLKLNLTPRQRRKLWRHVETVENFWESLEETEPGAIARLGALASQQRWEVIFLTKRPATAGETAQVQTQRWLEARGFARPSVFVVQGSRGRIAAALHLSIVVDDRPENCLDVVVDSDARAILVWREAERRLPPTLRRLGIGVVPSFGDCLTVLAQIDGRQANEASVFDRVLRLLGRKEDTQPA